MSLIPQSGGRAPIAPSMIPRLSDVASQYDSTLTCKTMRDLLREDSKLLDYIPLDDIVIRPLEKDDIPRSDRKREAEPILMYKMRLGSWKQEDSRTNSQVVWCYLSLVQREQLPHVRFFKDRKRLRGTEKVNVHGVLEHVVLDLLGPKEVYERALIVFVVVCFVLKGIQFPARTKFPLDFRKQFRSAMRALKSGPTLAKSSKTVTEAGASSSFNVNSPCRDAKENAWRGLGSGIPGALKHQNLHRDHLEPWSAQPNNNVGVHQPNGVHSLYDAPFSRMRDVGTSIAQVECSDRTVRAGSWCVERCAEPAIDRSDVNTEGYDREGRSSQSALVHGQDTGTKKNVISPMRNANRRKGNLVINKALRDALRPVMLLRQKRKADKEELGSVTRKRFLEEEKRDKEQDEIENTINEGKVLQQKLDELKARVEEKTLAYSSTEKRVKALYEEQDAVQKRVDQSEAEETEMLVGHEWLKEAIKR